MKLEVVPFDRTFCPSEVWNFLRPPVVCATANVPSAPDMFLWGARVSQLATPDPTASNEDTVWVWDRSGGAPVLGPGCSKDTAVRVLVLETDGSELETYGLYLKTSFQQQAAQDVEWVVAIQNLARRFQYSPAERGLPLHWNAALRACSLEAHLGILAQRSKFIFLTSTETQLLYSKKWDLVTFELLETFPQELRDSILRALQHFTLTGSHAKEAIHFSLMLLRKFGLKTALQVLSSPHPSAESFRNTLFHTAQPELAVLTQRRLELLRGLHAPPRSTVFGDPSFEKDMIRITHQPKSIHDVEIFRSWLSEQETIDGLRALLEIYQ